jgi:hypothetical protein
MPKFEQCRIAWSAEDQATYAKWRRWMLTIYGSVVVAVLSVLWLASLALGEAATRP